MAERLNVYLNGQMAGIPRSASGPYHAAAGIPARSVIGPYHAAVAIPARSASGPYRVGW